MSILEEVLFEEYNRSLRIEKAIVDEQSSLPKGSIQFKHIANKDYPYLVYREGDKVVSRYLKSEEVDQVASAIRKRKENNEALKELRKSIRQISKTLGEDYINEHSK